MAGIFGAALINPKQRYGEGYDPTTGTMSLDSGSVINQQITPPPANTKPAFFGEGGTGRNIAGLIGDALMQYGGLRPIYQPAQQMRQKAMLQAQADQQKRAADFTDWQQRFDYQRANPAPVNNDTVNDYNFRVQTLGKAAADEWLKSASDPIVTVTLPGNRVYSGPRSGLAAALGGGGGSNVPAAPVGKLTPIMPGGAPSQGGATFPDPLAGPGKVTSMRRTPEGNRAVGGVPNSRHLTGEAVDVVGASPVAIRAFYGPNARLLNEGDHIHVTVPGARFPYFGRNGTKGLR